MFSLDVSRTRKLYTDFNELPLAIKKQIVNATYPERELRNVDKMLKNKSKFGLDTALLQEIVCNVRKLNNLKESIKNNAIVDLNKINSDDVLIKSQTVLNKNISKKSVNNDLFKEGLLPESVMNKKREVRAKIKKEKKIEHRKDMLVRDMKFKDRKIVKVEDVSFHNLELMIKNSNRKLAKVEALKDGQIFAGVTKIGVVKKNVHPNKIKKFNKKKGR